MLDKDALNQLFSVLLKEASTPNYLFNELSGSWGFRTSAEYADKRVHFMKSLRELARNCNIRCFDGRYYIFDGRIYTTVKKDLLLAAYQMLIEHLRIVPMMDNKTVGYEFLKWISYYNPLEVRKDVIAFSNGVLDLVNLSFNDFNPRFHVTYMHPYPYEPKARCPMWLSFLHEVLPDKNSRLILQMFLGLGLIERGTAYNQYEGRESNKVELCLILIGGGSNGKSVVYNTAIGIFGKDRISSADYEELTGSGDEGMRARTLLHDALFNWSSDSDPRTFGRKRNGVFKRIVSGEPVTVRKIGEDVKEENHLPFLIFNLNELPYPDDQSLGFIRRLQFVTFDVTIPVERQNKALSYELTKEYPGIFNWILRGSRELKRRKFVFPSSEGNRRQVLLTQLKVNPVLAWVGAYQMRPEPMAKGEQCKYIAAKTLIKSLEQFCDDNDVEMVSVQKFGQTMRKIGKGFFKKRITGGAWVYQIFGCSEDRLHEHFVITDPDNELALDYVHEKGTFVNEDD